MLLLLVRHAHAGARDPSQWPDDRLRPLTDKGRKSATKVARTLRDLDLTPEAVFTSPWTRAGQTAELLVRHAGVPQPAINTPALAADPDLDALDHAVGPRGEQAIVALVGHSPWIEELGALLLTGTADGLRLDMPKGGVLGLVTPRLEPAAATLRFFLRPKML